jgi:predicted membrane protein
MKTYNSISKNHSGRAWGGSIILLIGIIFFLQSLGLTIPNWIVSWHTLLILVGLYVGFRGNFHGNGWLIMVLIGAYFTLNDIVNFNLGRFYFPIAFIILGLYLILKPRREFQNGMKKRVAFQDNDLGSSNQPLTSDGTAPSSSFENTQVNENDFVDFLAIFSGTHHKIFSKSFKGGNVTAIFGGCELNMSQTDFSETVVLDVVAIFGGTKFIIPPTWEVKSEITAVFGGVDDKRAIVPFGDGPSKVLIIKGVALFGGVEIKNF